MTSIQHGDNNEAVTQIQQTLNSQGFYPHPISGQYRKKTKDAVVYFQQTHIDESRQPLSADGIVGKKTLWALSHPSGSAQHSNIQASIPKKLNPERTTLLEFALSYHGAKENPDGSNWGDEVAQFGGIEGSPWCGFFWSFCMMQRTGRYPMKAKFGRCKSAWYRAKALNMARLRGEYSPIPGDAFVMAQQHKGRLVGIGHIGFVLRVEYEKGVPIRINTLEGNCGNRVKIGIRDLRNDDIVGFINCYPDDVQADNWEKGVVEPK